MIIHQLSKIVTYFHNKIHSTESVKSACSEQDLKEEINLIDELNKIFSEKIKTLENSFTLILKSERDRIQSRLQSPLFSDEHIFKEEETKLVYLEYHLNKRGIEPPVPPCYRDLHAQIQQLSNEIECHLSTHRIVKLLSREMFGQSKSEQNDLPKWMKTPNITVENESDKNKKIAEFASHINGLLKAKIFHMHQSEYEDVKMALKEKGTVSEEKLKNAEYLFKYFQNGKDLVVPKAYEHLEKRSAMIRSQVNVFQKLINSIPFEQVVKERRSNLVEVPVPKERTYSFSSFSSLLSNPVEQEGVTDKLEPSFNEFSLSGASTSQSQSLEISPIASKEHLFFEDENASSFLNNLTNDSPLKNSEGKDIENFPVSDELKNLLKVTIERIKNDIEVARRLLLTDLELCKQNILNEVGDRSFQRTEYNKAKYIIFRINNKETKPTVPECYQTIDDQWDSWNERISRIKLLLTEV